MSEQNDLDVSRLKKQETSLLIQEIEGVFGSKNVLNESKIDSTVPNIEEPVERP